MIYVGGVGPSNAKLAVIGEAPGGEEERLGYPFAGPSGQMVNKFLETGGISRDSVYLSNIVKVRPPNNDIKKLHLLGKSIEDFLPQLWNEIESLKPNAILAFGGTALKYLTGLNGIEKYRGSILPSSHGLPKVIPTIHPAAMLHKESEGKMKSWKDMVFIQWDVNRAIEESRSPALDLPRRHLTVARNSLDVYRFFERFERGSLTFVDIECYKTVPTCIAFSLNPSEGMSIPLINLVPRDSPKYIPTEDLAHIWKSVSEFLARRDIYKGGQNFKFDQRILEDRKLPTLGFFTDTMLGFRTLYPELPGKLEFISSVLTREPYYKVEGKEFNPKKDNPDRLYLYNARDSVVTHECWNVIHSELKSKGLLDFFFNRIMPLHPFYYRIEGRGIKRDEKVQKELDEKYKEKVFTAQDHLDTLVGQSVNVNSPKQVGRVMYVLLRLPVRKDTGEETIDALLRNVVKDPPKRRVLELIKEIRKIRKTRGTYINAETDKNGRLKTGYRIMLETGRTSTSVLKPPVTISTQGLAFQTLTKHGDVGQDIRRMLIPDEGYCFIEPDLSGAEARVVALLAGDELLLKIFEYKIDVHRFTKSQIDSSLDGNLIEMFKIGDHYESLRLSKEINRKLKEAVRTDSERQLGKSFRHAGHYDMEKGRASVLAGVSEWKAGQILEKFHTANPRIRSVFHAGIRQALEQNNRVLISPFGRYRQFYNKWGRELWKEAYAHLPQSTVSDHLKFSAQRIERRCIEEGIDIRIVQESHDSFLAGVPRKSEVVKRTIVIIKEELETPIDFSLCSLKRGTLTIPCEIKIGFSSWFHMRKIA